MKRFQTLVFATIASSLVFASPVISGASADGATPQTIEIYGGVIDENHPLYSADPYTEVSTDLGVTWHPAYLVGGDHPWGNVDGTNSWLNCGPSLSDCLNVRSDYRYRFYLPAGWSASSLVADMKIDNYGWVSLNGTDISGRQDFAWHSDGPIPLDQYTHTGWNELRVVLVDEGGLAGINFHLTYNVTAPSEVKIYDPTEPSSLPIDFDVEGGQETYSTITYNFGAEPVVLPTPTKPGYIFKGWAKNSLDGLIVDSSTYIPDEKVTLHALWERVVPSEVERTPQVTEDLAETGFDLSAYLLASLILSGAGLLLIRKTKRS